MSRYVIDASVALKWFVEEEYSRTAVGLLQPSCGRLAPDLLLPELGNILWKKQRRKEIGREEGFRLLNDFKQIPVTLFPSRELLGRAFEIAVTFERTLYDSMYVALAIAENCPLVTADRKLYNALSAGAMAKHLCWIEHARTERE